MKVIYEGDNKQVLIIVPAQSAIDKYGIEKLALKNVPANVPFWIVSDDEFPLDDIFRDAWEIPDDYRAPDGYGSKYNSYKEIENANSKL